MANTTPKKNKNVIIGSICAAIVIIVAIVVAIVIINNNNKYSDSFFKTDDSKYVLTMEYDPSEAGENEYTPLKTHSVYTYSGNTITGLTTYYEYPDDAAAKKAYDYVKNEASDSFKSISLDGKYVIFESNPEDYEDTTAEEVRARINFVESMKNGTLDEASIDADTEVVESGEGGEVVEGSETETTVENTGTTETTQQ